MNYGLVSMKRTLTYANGWAAEMVYCLPASAVAAHIAANYLMAYPGTSNLHVSQITDEPWMDGDVVGLGGLSGTRKLTYQFALDYLDVPWPTCFPRPTYKAGTTLKLSVKSSAQYLIVPATPELDTSPSSEKPQPQYLPMDPNKKNTILIALRDFIIEQDRCQDLGNLDFKNWIGCVNSDTFLGQEPGTLLCEGVTLDPSFVLNPSNPHAWRVQMTLKSRRIVVDGADRVYGWNDDYDRARPGWGPTKMAGDKSPYESNEFKTVFN